MATILSYAQILDSRPAFRDVPVKAWGGDVRVQAFTVRSQMELLDAISENVRAVADYEADQALPEIERKGVEKVEPYDHTILSLIFSIVDENGNLMFSPKDHDIFRSLSYPTIKGLWLAAHELNSDVPVTTRHENLKKNSD